MLLLKNIKNPNPFFKTGNTDNQQNRRNKRKPYADVVRDQRRKHANIQDFLA